MERKCRLRTGMCSQTASYVSLLAAFNTHSFCTVRTGRRCQRGRQLKCGSELVISAKTEGGGNKIRVDEKTEKRISEAGGGAREMQRAHPRP